MGSCNSANAQVIIQKTSIGQSTSRSHIKAAQVNHAAITGSSTAKAVVDKSYMTETANASEMSKLCGMPIQIEARNVIDTYTIASNGIICTVPQLMAVGKSSILTRRASQMYPLKSQELRSAGQSTGAHTHVSREHGEDSHTFIASPHMDDSLSNGLALVTSFEQSCAQRDRCTSLCL